MFAERTIQKRGTVGCYDTGQKEKWCSRGLFQSDKRTGSPVPRGGRASARRRCISSLVTGRKSKGYRLRSGRMRQFFIFFFPTQIRSIIFR